MKKTAFIAMLVMSVVPFLITCGRGAPPPKEDFIPPTVLATTPKDGFMDFPITGSVKIEFSEEMDPATINAQTIVLTSSTGTGPVSGSILYGNATAIFAPEQPLQEQTLHTVTIRGTVTDKFGNLMGRDYSFSFMTQLFPSVQGTVPGDGATLVPVNQSISVTFSKQINPLTLNFSLMNKTAVPPQPVPFDPPMTSGGVSFVIVPHATALDGLEGDTVYEAKVSAGLEDYNFPVPNKMQQDYVWTFTTGPSRDTIPPFVQVTDPDNGAFDVSVTPQITVSFNESLNTSSTPTLMLFTAGSNTILCRRDAGNSDQKYHTFYLPPAAKLNYFKQYLATVSAGLKDTAVPVPNEMTAPYSWTFTTLKASTTTTISVPANVSYGNVTVTVTVASSAGTPTGLVTLSTAPSPTVSLSQPLNSSGVAIFTISNPSVNDYHSLSATYVPPSESMYQGSGSSTGFSVSAAGSTTTVTSSSPTSTFNASVIFTATVAPSNATGSVTFYDGGAWLGSAALFNGTALYSTATLTSGPHTITAAYSGDGSYGSSTSPAITQTVTRAATATTVGSSSNPSTFGASVTFTAAVTSSESGTVTFKDGATVIGTGTLTYGTALFSTAVLSVGTHSITAVYGGSANFAPSTSAVFPHVVSKVPTTTSINVPANVPYSNVTVTVTVLSSAGTPTGSVTLRSSPSPSVTLTQTLNSSGVAVFIIPNPIVNVYHTLDATYTPPTGSIYLTSAGSGGFSVGAAGSTTTVTSSSPTSSYGASVTFTSTVTPSTATGTVTFYDGITWLGQGIMSSGTATFSISTLVVGPHTITATYNGDGSYSQSTSPAITQTVNPAATTTVVTSSPNPSAFGASVTFTATVAPSAATGTVTFSDGATVLGTGTLSGGLATLSTTALAAGPHTITAAYGGSTSFVASTSAAITQTVSAAATTTVVTSSPNPSAFGASVTFTATVSSSTATGTVTFRDEATAIGTGTLTAGLATFSTTTLAAGTHSITAAYGGSTSFAASTSAAITQTVSAAATTTVVTSSPNPSVFGASVTFTATVSSSTATGTVTFSDGATVLGTGTLSAGLATFATSTLGGGIHSITAAYGGNASFGASTSAAITQTVNAAATTTVVTSSPNPSTFGASVMFSATVAPSTATGTVTFSDGATVLGTGTLAAGLATFSTTALVGGPHSITATYGGSTSFAASTSAAITQTVSAAATTTVVTSSPNPSTFGASVMFSATVSSSTATGTVTFSEGATVLGTGTLTAGLATFSTTALAVGPHSITAAYGGSASFAASTSAAITQTVSNTGTTTVVTSNPNPSVFGASVTFSATVAPSAATGIVTFRDGATVLGTGTLSGGLATFATSTLSGGIHSIRAYYGGDTSYTASTSSPLAHEVDPAVTATVVTSSPNPSAFGASVMFSATVAPSAATGIVTFSDGATVLGTGTLSGGLATFSTTALAAGPHSITAAYGGSANFAASASAAITQTVNAAATTTVVTSGPNPSTFGASVMFSATVSSSTATGTVTFSEGATVLGTGSLSAGLATFSTTALAVGPHAITAAYGGSANFAASTSAAITQNVNAVVTATATANGTLDGTTPSPATVSYGSTASFKFNANANYHVASVTGTCGGTAYNNTSNTVTTYTYTTPAITAGCAVTANFAINTYPVTATAAANGTLDGTTPSPATVSYGSTVNFKFNANANYHVASVTDTCGGTAYNNTSNTVTTYTYVTPAITAGCAVTANFAINTYPVTATAAANGTLDGTTPSPATVNYGLPASFKFNANANYHVASVTDTCGGTAYNNTSNTVTTYTYTTPAITAAGCSVTANFAINSFTVSTSAGSGGSIVPTSVTVNYNSTYMLTVSAIDPNYIASISGCGGTDYTNIDPTVTTYNYTTGPITGDCTVTATYNNASLALIGATQGIGFGSLGAMSFLLNHKLFGNLFRRRRKQNGSRDNLSKKVRD